MHRFVLIGVDGGATKVSAHEVQPPSCPSDGFRLGSGTGNVVYRLVDDFTPVAIAEQLDPRAKGEVRITQAEHQQGRLFVEAAASAILKALPHPLDVPVRIGIGMPGLKTSDRRGIEVMNNGPRLPDYLNQLEAALKTAGIQLDAPIHRLGSDADYCGLGEEYAEGGRFRNVENGYYIGGGSGLAEALKLRGALVPFDETASWLLKAWQMTGSQGETFEKLIAPKAVNARFSMLAGQASEPAFPEQQAAQGNRTAQTLLREAASALAELVFERLHTLAHGRQRDATYGDAHRRLNPDHEYCGTHLDRVVIGQRLGSLFAGQPWAEYFRHPFHEQLAGRLVSCGSPELIESYLHDGKLLPGWVVVSPLREAPALGAAIDAWRA